MIGRQCEPIRPDDRHQKNPGQPIEDTCEAFENADGGFQGETGKIPIEKRLTLMFEWRHGEPFSKKIPLAEEFFYFTNVTTFANTSGWLIARLESAFRSIFTFLR